MITLHDIHHTFGERSVLRGITTQLTEPRVGIIGANGCGKSTLVRLFNGLLTPSRGRIEVHGLDVATAGREVRQRVGFVFPDPDAQIIMPTVGEDVAFSLRRLRLSDAEKEQRITETLSFFGLLEHRDHPAHQLSSGQKQLLALASVVIMRPDILICDEPTTLLDRRHARRVMGLINQLDQQVILVTHHLELVESWGRVLVIDEGRIGFDGSGADAVRFYTALIDAPDGDQPQC